MGEEPRLTLLDGTKPGSGCRRSALEALELLHGPPDQVLINAPRKEAQLGAVEGPVIGLYATRRG